jgi:hypothetical protein
MSQSLGGWRAGLIVPLQPLSEFWLVLYMGGEEATTGFERDSGAQKTSKDQGRREEVCWILLQSSR